MPSDPPTHLEPSFGFALPDDAWLERLHRAESPVAPGRIGEYRIVREIARGGQGVVYRAVQPRTDRPIALKCLPGWHVAGAAARARFEREIEAICKLAHPGIVTLHEVQLIDGQPVIAMEWVEGEPIDRWAAALPAPALNAILSCFLELCDAVAHAHRRGVIHRDLKPGNIFVDAQHNPRVLDFGLAKLTASDAPNATHAPGFVGTPLYASPEQISEQSTIDTRTDVYSLGVILYQLVTGAPPFDAPTTAEVFDRVRAGAARTPSSIAPALPTDLDSIIARAMALEPERRYGTVDALADDLRRLRAGEPVLAHPAGAWYRLSRAVRRRPLTSLGAAAALTGLVALTTVNSVLSIRLRARDHQLSGALAEAQSARVRAEHAADANASAVSLLQDLLDAVQHAAQARAKKDAVRDVLAKACQRLEQGGHEPDQQDLVLWTTLAEVASQGLYSAELERCVRTGMPLCETIYGPASAQYAEWLIYNGLVRESHADWDQAADLYARARVLLKNAGATTAEPYARATYNLGAMKMRTAKDRAEAETLLNESLGVRRQVHGDPSPLVVRTLVGLGDLSRRALDNDKANAYLDRAEKAAVTLDPFDPRLLTIPVVRARVLVDQNNLDDADVLLRKTVADLEARVALDSPLLTQLLGPLVDIAEKRSRFEEAISLSDRLLLTIEQTNEPGRLVQHAVRRSHWLVSLNRREQARTELRAALTKAQTLTPPSPRLVDSVNAALSAVGR